MGSNKPISKFSKKNRLLLTILLSSIAVVFAFLGVLLYINYYARVSIVLTTITRYRDGDIKNVSEFDIITVKKGRSITTFPKPKADGYSFEGWYFDKECNEPYDYNTVLNENMQIYGKMNLLEYSIELILDDNVKVVKNLTQDYKYTDKFTIEDIIKLPRFEDRMILEDRSKISVSEYKLKNKEGYTFEGWGFSSTATSAVTFDYRMNPQNITFYAIWKPIQVELKYCTVDLSFAQNSPQSGFIEDRLYGANGGVKYNTYYNVYVSETLDYGTKVRSVVDPVDEFANFVFAGWYLDPEFTVPVKFSQLYIRNGHFSLTKERNINILKDPLYFDGGYVVDDDTYNRIAQYKSSDENNSYINIFAKWELKKYTVRYHLNLPEGGAYVDTALMSPIINSGFERYIYSDNGDTLKENTNVYQGKELISTYVNSGVLYDANYFKNVIYINHDLTGLPLYTLHGWNSKKDGSGYDASNAGDYYFDKSKFDIVDDVITIYAQWSSYYRVNYYLTDGSMGDSILLSTINVVSNKIEVPSLESLVVSIDNREVTFTEHQKVVNEAYWDMSRDYLLPLNKTFVGWINDYSYVENSMPLYIEGVRYDVGTNVDRETGIYLNEPVRNLYTAWVDNINTYSYDLGEDGIEKADFSKNSLSLSLESRIIESNNGTKNYRKYVYDKTNSDTTLITIYNEQFLVTKYLDSKLYSLNGWKMKDGSRFEGHTSQEIKFNKTSRFIKFITNSEPDNTAFKEVNTGVYYEGVVNINNERYFTVYNASENKSYIVLRANNVTQLVFEAVWVKNIILTYNAGVDDAVWADGYSADSLTAVAGGNVYMQLSDPADILTRPYYKFYGWSTINREGDEIINFNTFENENTIYQPNTRYDLFEDDTELFAVWQPIVYNINLFQKSVDSETNSSAGRIYVAKECFIYNRNEITDGISIEGNVISYHNTNGNVVKLTMTTSAVAGYGLSGWSDSENTPLTKDNGVCTISPKDDVNNLFEKFPQSTYNNINVYPIFSILKFDVVFKILGEGINSSMVLEPEVSYEDVIYGTNLKNLLPKVYNNYYVEGYTFKGWMVSGDVDNRGNIKDDYIANINSANILAKSDLTITIIAEKLSYTVKIVFNSPSGETKEIVNYHLNHYDTLSELSDEIKLKLLDNQYVGYNFSHWQTTIGGMTTNLTEANFANIKITSPLELYSKYTKAKVVVIYNYESDGETITVEKDAEYMSSFSLNTTLFEKQPNKEGFILKGWAKDESNQVESFALNSSFVISEAVVGSSLVRPEGTDYYNLNLYAKWVEAMTLTFDTSEVDIAYTDFPTSLKYEKDSVIFFKDIPYISYLSNDTISQKNGLGEYSEKWVDQSGKEYAVTTTSSFIRLSNNITLKPKFNPRSFSIVYNYYYMGTYSSIHEITKTVSEQYTAAPNLLTKLELDETLVKINKLSNYRATGYYLTKKAFEEGDTNYKFDLGAEFDFINNTKYLSKAVGSKFEFYIILQEMSNITYYTDRSADAAISSVLKLDKGAVHIIGDTNGDGTVDASDYTPEKKGFSFIGWNSSLSLDYKQYSTGEQVLAGAVSNLYPVWESLPIIVEYRDSNNDILAIKDDIYTDDIVTLKSFSREGSELSGWATSIGGAAVYQAGKSLDLSEALTSVVFENGSYYLRLYAIWQIAQHYVGFDVYSANGAKSVLYGKKDATTSSSYVEEIYDSATLVEFTFPTTAASYEVGGQKYLFTGEWTDGINDYTSATVSVKFIKNYNFTPVYNKVHTLTFKNGSDIIFELENVIDGSEFVFNYADLLTATSNYNTGLMAAGSKVIAYTDGENNFTASSSITVNSSLVFTAVVTDLINIVLYKDLAYNGSKFTFSNPVSQYNVELSSKINLDDFTTTLSGCSTAGYVATTDMSYEYVSNPKKVEKGNYSISASGANKGATLYFYAVIQTTVTYYVNNVQSDSETVRLGANPTKTEITDGEGEYYTGWKVGSSSGASYETAPVTGPLSLYTISKPYLQLMVSTSDTYIKNSDELLIDGKKPTDSFTLPVLGDVELRESSKYSISGWYISYQGSFVMQNSTTRKKYNLGSTIKLEDVISDLGITGELAEVYFEMTPEIAYNLKTLTIKNSSNISYNFNVTLTVSTAGLNTNQIDNLKNSFVVDNEGYAFYLLNGSTISIDNDTISFEAYLKNNGNVVITNNAPTTATITISKTVDAGYSSVGWYYVDKNELVAHGTKIELDTTIKAQTAVAESVQLSINLIYKNGDTETILTSSNISSYVNNFYIVSDSKYTRVIDTEYGSIINFNVVIVEGYEFVELRNSLGNAITANISSSSSIHTFTYEVGSETQIYVVVKKSETYKPSISINTDAITNFDSSKINSSSTMYLTYRKDSAGSSWNNLLKNTTEYRLNWAEFGKGYKYSSAIEENSLIQIFTAINSAYYYVDTINVYNNGSLSNGDGGNNTVQNNQIISGIKVTGVVDIELVLKERTYSVNYYDESGSLVEGKATNVADTISISLPIITKEGYDLNGYRLSRGTSASDVEFVEYLTASKDYLITEIQKSASNIKASNQNSYILLEPVWVNKNYEVSITSNNGYFLVNNVRNDSVAINIPYNEVLTLNKTVKNGVFETNSITFVTKTYSIDTNGIITSTNKDYEIVFIPYGTWEFVEGYSYNTTGLFDDKYTVVGDVVFVPNIEKGEGSITISITDADYTNQNLSLGKVVITSNSDESEIDLVYDEDSELNVDAVAFETLADCSVAISINSPFSVASYDIVINGLKLSDYDDLDDFKSEFANLSISISGDTIVLDNLIYDIEIIYNLSRDSYDAYIQVSPATAGSDLETTYNELVSNNTSIAKLDGTEIEVGNPTLVDCKEIRKSSTYSLTFNSDYFVVQRIYYIDDSVEYTIYGTGMAESLSTFNPLTNELTIVYGGNDGCDITFYVELALKTLDVIFHGVNNVYASGDDYTSYDSALITPDETINKAFGSSLSLSSGSLFTPVNTIYNGLTLEFVGWTYYNGNYEKDNAEGKVDNSKFVELSTINWTFGAVNGNLHIFSNWAKQFNVSFEPSNDGISSNQSNLPESIENVILTDEILFTVASRNGFTFGGYMYTYDGDSYYLRYNGTNFTALEDGENTVETIEPFTEGQITLAQIITSDMASIYTTFAAIVFEPIWTRNAVALTINSSDNGVVENYKYNGTSYEKGNFDIKYYYTLHVDTIELDTVTYNCLYVKNNNVVVGAIVVKPDANNYYKFGQFKVNGSSFTSSIVLNKATTITVEYAADFVPHTINLAWDKSNDGISYQLDNLSASAIKVKTYNNGSIETTSTINAGNNKTYTATYDKIIVYALRDSEVNVRISLNGYHYVDGTNKSEISLSISESSHNAATANSYTLKLNTVTINLSQHMLSDLNTTSNAGGKYFVSYFAPINQGGLITGYDTELTVVEVNNTTAQLTGIVGGTKLYFDNESSVYEIIQLLNGNSDITNSDTNANNIYIKSPKGGEYDVKVVFDAQYAEVNFEINGESYASGYFTTTEGSDANIKLVAFANMITSGYSNSSSYLGTLFDDVSLLTGNADSTVQSNIVRENGVEKTYYTEGDFISMFNYAINQNLATIYYNNDNWKNVWFNEFNFSSAYPSSSITIDNLYIGAGTDEVVFQATTSTALVLAVLSDLENIGNATAQGGLQISNIQETTLVIGNSEVGYNGSYKNLYLKVKNDTVLPKISVITNMHTYANKTIPFSEQLFSNSDTSGLLTNTDDGFGYEYTHYFKVKQVNLMLESTDKDSDTNYSFENNFSNPESANYRVMSINYATSFEQVKSEYRLQESYTEVNEYVFKGFYTTSGDKIDIQEDFTFYFENYNSGYFDGASIYINAVYEQLVSE